MKCPKCGFNSFEFLDSCKKCGVNLVSFKKNHGIDALVYTAAPVLAAAKETPTTAAMPETASLSTASPFPPPLSEPDAEEEMTWDFSAAEETAPKAESAFSGFEFDFMKEDEKDGKQQEQGESFSFAEESPVQDRDGIEVKSDTSVEDFSDFSFYEETIDPKEMGISSGGESDTDIFGETGVIGEILPEQLQAAGEEQAQEAQPQSYENEFVLDDFIEEPEELDLEEVEEPGSEQELLDLTDVTEELQPPPGEEPEGYGNEFVFEDFAGQTEELALEQEEPQPEQKEPKKDPLELIDFDKEFESLFAMDETSGDTGKGRS